MKTSTTVKYIILFLIVIGGLIVSSIITKSGSKKLSNRELALTCTTDMATEFHIHPYLKIFINGVQQEIPTNIGIDSGCMHPLHTHDKNGEIHVESPQKRDFILGDFFTVWKKSFSKDKVLDYKADDTHVIRETVNGVEVQDYENTILYDKDQIVIYYEAKK
jgi:hypothetical protein